MNVESLSEILAKKSLVKKPSALTEPELVLLYSPPGGGKTHLAASVSELPHVKKVLILDTEGSTAGTVVGFDEDVLDIVDASDIDVLDVILDKLFDPETSQDYDAVIIDTFDVAQDAKVKQLQATYGTTGDAVFKVWGEVKEWTISTARKMKAMKALGIIVFHDREEKSPSGAIVTKLQVAGSAKDILPGIPDVVAYLDRATYEDGSEHTTAYFGSSDGKITKNRFTFPPEMFDPSFVKMYEHINNKSMTPNTKENN